VWRWRGWKRWKRRVRNQRTQKSKSQTPVPVSSSTRLYEGRQRRRHERGFRPLLPGQGPEFLPEQRQLEQHGLGAEGPEGAGGRVVVLEA
jgi:hypothetical protein